MPTPTSTITSNFSFGLNLGFSRETCITELKGFKKELNLKDSQFTSTLKCFIELKIVCSSTLLKVGLGVRMSVGGSGFSDFGSFL